MAQTPKSLSANVNTPLPTTIYTVPSGTTAVVKSIIPATNLSSQTITLNKVSGGTTYPLIKSYTVPITPATGATVIQSPNLLPGPITLAANESLTASVTNYTVLNGQKTIPIISTTYQLQSGSPYFTANLFANGIYMAVGYINGSTGVLPQNNGFVVTSTDGSNWTFQGGFPTGYSQLKTLTYGGGIWVVTGYDSSSNNSATVWTSSSNGVSWTKVTLPSSTSWAYQGFYANGNFIVGDSQGYIYVSTDGLTWTRQTGLRDLCLGAVGNGYNYIRSVSYVNSIYFFGTKAGTVTSTDLTTYTSPYLINSGNVGGVSLYWIQYSPINTTWYAFGATNGNTEATPCLFTSSDGISWTWNTTLYSSNILNGGYNPTQFAVSKSGTNANIYIGACNADTNTITYSTNGGTSWTRGASASSNYKGPFRTLSNGGFVQYSQAANDANAVTTYIGIWNINVNPALTTVTQQFSLGTHSYGLIYDYLTVASNGTGWVGWFSMADVGNTRQFGGTSASTCIDFANLSPTGYAISATWLPATSKYYMITDQGYVYSTPAYNTSMTSLGRVTGVTTSDNFTITTFGSYLVVTTSTGAKYSTDGITWTSSTTPSLFMGGIAGAPGRGADTSGSKTVALYTTNQVLVTTDGTTYTTMPYPDGMLYQTTKNGLNFASYCSSAISTYTGSFNSTYTSSTFAGFPSGYTKLGLSGFGSPAYTSDNPSYNYGLIDYTNSTYLFSLSSQANPASQTGITYSTDLLNFSTVLASSVGALNGVSYYQSTGETLNITTNSSGQIVFVVPSSPTQGAYTTTTTSLAVPTTLSAGIVEIS
jgi:hypothetical protein